MTIEAIIIADDLTGAADTGVQFTALGAPVYLIPAAALSRGHPRMATAAGISLYTASRGLSPGAAAERVRQVARAFSRPRPRWVYKKVDSCLRGNLGAEIDGLLDVLGLDAALVAPALPAQGRTTVDGIHRVRGIPLARTPFASDPITPVTRSSVAQILASQSRYTIGRISMESYGDPGRLQGVLRRERGRGCRLIVCDAAEQAHLDQLAALVVRDADRLLPVGSAGLATALIGQLSSDRMIEPAPVPGSGRGSEWGLERGLQRLLMVCGTGARITHAQLDALLDRYPGVRHQLEPAWLLTASPQDRRRCADDLLAAWTGGILALTVRPPPTGGLEMTPEQATAGLAGLAGLAVEILRAGPVDGLFLSGGETADAFLQAAGGEAIALQREVLPGLVLGRWVGGIADGLPVVTKAGAFGARQTLVTLYGHVG